MREIVFDTETTGLDFAVDRVVEIGCVELINHIPTGREFHVYLNPERPMPTDAFAVHGLSDTFLADKPRFAAVAEELVAFLADSVLIAHNAEFDVGFINAELRRVGMGGIEHFQVVDTLALARRRHPAGPNSLDALCGRYGIDLSKRTLHGALLDAALLADVYIELLGGRQASLMLDELAMGAAVTLEGLKNRPAIPRPEPRPVQVSEAELAAHRALIGVFGAPAIWQNYLPAQQEAA
jgi:DNA polymerase-3 subunit epsilon